MLCYDNRVTTNNKQRLFGEQRQSHGKTIRLVIALMNADLSIDKTLPGTKSSRYFGTGKRNKQEEDTLHTDIY